MERYPVGPVRSLREQNPYRSIEPISGLVRGPELLIRQFNRSQIWLRFKRGASIVIRYRGEVKQWPHLFLNARDDLLALKERSHFDYCGSNIIDQLERRLEEEPDLIDRCTIELDRTRELTETERRQLEISPIEENAHPVARHVWQWLSHVLGNRAPRPDLYRKSSAERLIHGPEFLVEQFNRSRIYFYFTESIAIFRTNHLYLDADPDLVSLFKRGHFDFGGSNFIDQFEQILREKPSLIERCAVETKSRVPWMERERKELTISPIAQNAHPIAHYVWQWLSHILGNEKPRPGAYSHVSSQIQLVDQFAEEDFICPITQLVMENPVQDIHGHHFEESAIREWMRTRRRCPLNQMPLKKEDIQPDEEFRAQLREPSIREMIQIWQDNTWRAVNQKIPGISPCYIQEVLDYGLEQYRVLQAFICHFSENENIFIPYFESGCEQNDALERSVSSSNYPYVVCSYDVDPTELRLEYKHQIALIIELHKRRVIYIDSLSQNRDRNPQLLDLIHRVPLRGFTLHSANLGRMQQSREGEDAACCGIYTFQNGLSYVEKGEVYSLSTLRGEQLTGAIREFLTKSNSIAVETFLHQMMRQDYQVRHAFLEIPMQDKRYPMEQMYTSLSLISRSNQRDGKEWEDIQQIQEDDLESQEVESIAFEDIFKPTEERTAKKVLLVGRAGVGKTTLCRKMAFDWSSGKLWSTQFKSLVWIPLRFLNDSMQDGDVLDPKKFKDAEEWLCAVIAKIGLASLESSPSQDVKDYLVHHRSEILVLLDGYDEAQPIVTETIKRLIRDDRRHANPLHIMVLSRPGDLFGLYECMDTHLESIGFSDKQVDAYIEHFFHESMGQAEAFREALSRNKLLSGLRRIPLQLQMICSLYQRQPEMFGQQTITQLYTQIVEAFWNWSVDKNGVLAEKREAIFQSLGAIAKAGMDQGQSVLPEEAISAHMRVDKIQSLLGMGLLKAQGSLRQPSYIFLHLTFQEYLTAYYVVNQREEISYLRNNKFKPRTQQVFQFIAGLLDGEYQLHHNPRRLHLFFQEWREEPYDLVSCGYGDLLVLRCMNECDDQIIEDVNEMYNDILTRFSRHIKVKKIRDAIDQLPKIKPRLLQVALKSEDSGKRDLVRQFMGEIEAFIDDLQNEDWKVRETTIGKLHEVKQKNPYEILPHLEPLFKDRHWRVRKKIVEVLSHFIEEKAIRERLRSFLKDGDWRVRKSAYEQLKQGGEDVKMIKPHPLHAQMERIEERIELGDEISSQMIVLLFLALRNKEWTLRGMATKLLGKLRWESEEFIQILLSALQDSNFNVRLFAVEKLGVYSQKGGEFFQKSVEGLRSASHDEHFYVRRNATYMLNLLEEHTEEELGSFFEQELFNYERERDRGFIQTFYKEAISYAVTSGSKDFGQIVKSISVKEQIPIFTQRDRSGLWELFTLKNGEQVSVQGYFTGERIEPFHHGDCIREEKMASDYHEASISADRNGRYQEALENYNNALELVSNEFQRAAICHDRGIIYLKLNRREEALNDCVRALQILEGSSHLGKLGLFHLDVGFIYSKQKCFEQALEHYDRALPILERINHQKRIALYHNMGFVHSKKRRLDLTLKYYHRALEIGKNDLGFNRLELAGIYQDIGFVYQKQGEWENALENYDRALGMELEEGVSSSNMKVIQNYQNIIESYFNLTTSCLDHFDEIFARYGDKLEIKLKELLKNRDPAKKNMIRKALHTMVTGCHHLGFAYSKRGNFIKALEQYKKGLEFGNQLDSDPILASIHRNIGFIYNKEGHYEEALNEYLEELRILQSDDQGNKGNIEKCYDKIVDNRISLGYVYSQQSHFDSALEQYRQGLEMVRNDLKVAVLYWNMAHVYEKRYDYRNAVEYCDQSLQIRLSKLGVHDPNTQKTQKKLHFLRKKMKK